MGTRADLRGPRATWLAEISGFCRDVAPTQLGRTGRVRRAAGDQRRITRTGKTSPRRLPDPQSSAHGTNPASAVMAGMRVVVVKSCDDGTIDLDGPATRRRSEHADKLAAFMVTYPSTHGVFEEGIRRGVQHRARERRHGLPRRCEPQRPSRAGASRATTGRTSCHINLHKTFAIPHGGGGPGDGPHLLSTTSSLPYLPGHTRRAQDVGGDKADRPRVGVLRGAAPAS